MENLKETPMPFLQAGASNVPAEIRKPTVLSCSLQIQLKTQQINVCSIFAEELIFWKYMQTLLKQLFKNKHAY